MFRRLLHAIATWHLSIYSGIALWGAMAFSASPTIGSFFAHFIVALPLIFVVIFLARNEGRNG